VVKGVCLFEMQDSSARGFLAGPLAAICLLVLLSAGQAAGGPPLRTALLPASDAWSFVTSQVVMPQMSPRLDEAKEGAEPGICTGGEPRENPLAGEPDGGKRGSWWRLGELDVLASVAVSRSSAPPLTASWNGVGNPAGCSGCRPPDPVGAVGLRHYVQMVNATKITIYDKAGNLVSGPTNLGSLWPAGDRCHNNLGDPVVAYDGLADRWVLAQFANPHHLCFAVSTGPDPTSSYWTYTFDVGDFPDFFKIGVWPDAYYVGANETTYTAYAFDRSKMLEGLPATFQKFGGVLNFLEPADVSGPTPPPSGSPGLFYTFLDDSFHGLPADVLRLYSFHVDWTAPANTTFAFVDLPVTSFTYTVCGFFNMDCIPQGNTTQHVDAVSEWPMYRFAYRHLPGYEAAVGTFTINAGSGIAAPRWFELRNQGAGWALFEEGTYALGDGSQRFMGSIAIDSAGDLALAYSTSSATDAPSLRYAVRTPGDPAGTLSSEGILQAGGGAQTGLGSGGNRWGDYSALSVDPANGCDFYFTGEYYAADSTTNWSTRIGSFRLPGCVDLLRDGFEPGSTVQWIASVP